MLLVFTFTFLILQMHITEAEGVHNAKPLDQNCHAMAETQCQSSRNLSQYTECWEESIETCGRNAAVNQMRFAGQDCKIEEHLITENICYMAGICQDVSYTEYFIVC